METDFGAIQEGLRRLRKEGPLPKVFGSDSHEFRTNPPLSEKAVANFERQHSVVLSPDYRGFLIHVGNGGAGPSYGVFKLGEIDDGFGHRAWSAGGPMVGILSEPFPHERPWNDLSGRPEFDESRADDLDWEDEYNRQLDDWENERYWNPALVNGAIPICHLGCALRQWLVVTGPETGNIWNDDRADEAGLAPLQRDGLERVTFFQWYRHWLDGALDQLDGANGLR